MIQPFKSGKKILGKKIGRSAVEGRNAGIRVGLVSDTFLNPKGARNYLLKILNIGQPQFLFYNM